MTPAEEAVASLADAWIETIKCRGSTKKFMSRPSRTRGLKQDDLYLTPGEPAVASLADAWIETPLLIATLSQQCRVPRGRVD